VVLFKKSRAKKDEMASVRTEKVTRGTILQTISATGEIAAETGASVKIGSQVSGRIKRLYTDVGQNVQAGDVIAEIDAQDLKASLESAKRNQGQLEAKYREQVEGAPMTRTQLLSTFEQATQSLKRSEAARDQARLSLEAAKTRTKSSLAAQDGAEANVRSAEAQIRSAQAAVPLQETQTSAQLRSAQAAVESAEATLRQAQKNADLEVASSQASLKQAQSNASLASVTLKRQEALLAKGFVATADVDSARTDLEVKNQQVESAQANLSITREKVAADLASAQSGATEAHANLDSAKAGGYQDTIKSEALRSAQAGLTSAQASLTQAKHSVAIAQTDQATASSQITQAEADMRSARAAQTSALAGLTQNQLKQQEIKAAYEAYLQAGEQVKNQQFQFDKSFIRTPISGTVVSLTQQEGETVAAQLSAPTLISVVDLSRLEVTASVDETDIGNVKMDQEADISVDAYPDRKFKGRVTKIASAATVTDNVVTYDVTVKLDAVKDAILKPQMTADVTITIVRHDNAVLAPNEAVKKKKGGAQAAVLGKSGKAEVRTLKTGLTDSDNTEILEGLQEGDDVVVAGFDKLGIEGFSSQAQLPGFFNNRTPFGTSSNKAGAKGGQDQQGGAGGAKGGAGAGAGGAKSGGEGQGAGAKGAGASGSGGSAAGGGGAARGASGGGGGGGGGAK
jgi:HlyD family secretion protein